MDYWKRPKPRSDREPDLEWGPSDPDDPYRPSWEHQGAPSSSSSGGSDYQNPWSTAPSATPSSPPPSRPRGSSRPPRREGEVSERSARLTLTLFAGSVAVLILGLVVFFTVKTIRQGDDNPVSGTGDATPAASGAIGPPTGVDLAPYIESRKTALAQTADDRVAVVSLNEYLTESDARSLTEGVEVLAILAAAPGGQPSVVTGDIGTWVNSQTADARAERDEIQRLIPTAKDDPQFQNFYRDEVERLTNLIERIQPDGDLVFGLVVKGPAAALQGLAGKGEIRLVDVGPSADPGPEPVYRGIRPEEKEQANEPNVRPE